MARQCVSGLTKTKRGFCRTVGYYLNHGKRVPRKFWLGHDRAKALRKFKVLETAWDNLPGDRGTKVWTEEAINQALNSIALCPQPQTSSIDPTSNLPQSVPVFAPRPVPPPTSARTYTLFEALDEFTKNFSERTDIGQKHRDGTKSRIESIKTISKTSTSATTAEDRPISRTCRSPSWIWNGWAGSGTESPADR